ncbi:hypothetical protein AGDE_10252 [Angomonas deanei]|uniref:Concanavalin A-like lectin/glucanases superfamily, putative n=1 Tax=Angomonas deanei TaxID=59799 RepID=A0A7G2C143_9TRYP|nr:hypothetical protein AGDE_10252 [Angomonas deanei]CAD2213255.1 Concanavalin A-like lectin/glucanases superfamily, putative [Angomonas deanei]|eukprot:EPY28848.1 hypothetical protein AGDE_10252 [Angomonas deanei]
MSMYNSMNSGLENWGLLSVADVEEREVTAKSNTMDRISWVDNPNIPLFSKKKQKASQTYVDNLQKSYCESRISNRTTIEEVFSQQFGKLRLALKASEKKLKLQSSAELLDDPAVCPPAHNAILDAIGVLASLSFPAGNNGTIVANCLSLVDWRKASPSSSLEVFNLLVKTFFSQGNCTDSEVMLPMVSLSLKSGYLGPILWCVLHGAEGSVVGQIAPTAIDHCPVTHFKYALDSFTASFCQLPFSTGDEKISCFRFPPKKFCVCRSSTLVDYQVLGKQGSRVSRDREFTLTLQKGERVICRNEKQALTIQSCGYGSYCWRFRLNTFDLRKRSQQDSTPFVVNCTSLSASNFRFHFSIQQDRLICLLSRLSTQRISRSAYVASLPLSEIKQGGKEMVVSEACELKRPSVSTPQGLLRALQFRKGAGISVGHVSLKDEFSPFCVELWVLPSGIDETLTMITMGNKAVEEILLQVSCVSGGLEWRGGVRTPQLGNSFTTVFVPGQLGISRWWHVALNFTGMMWELFVDTQHTASQSAMVSSHGIADAECVLGPNLSGFLREVRVWNTARPINLLKRDWKRTLSGKEDGLIGYFPLNEHQGNVVMDHASGFHAMMGGNTSATWMPVRNVPVSLPENAPAISEFVPFAVAMDPDSVYFVVTACYYCVVSVVSLESLHIYYYGKTSLTLESYSETEIPTSWRVKSVGYNEEKDCIQCCCTVLEDASRLAMWDIHHVSVLQRPEEGITPGTVWEYGRQHLQKYARYAEKVLSADKYLNDQANWWCEKVPTCVLDYSPGVLQRLVELIEKAIHRSDSEMERCGSLLLHCNLFFRFRTNREALRDEVGDQFDTVTAFIDTSVNVEENKRGRSELPLRDRVAGFAFRNHSVLLQACLQCLLEEETKVQFIKSTAARDRGGREDAVFWALLEYCSMLQPLTSLMSSRPTAETFYGALIMESTFQVNQCYRTSDYAALSRVNRCLEAFQEFLFVQTCDTKSDRSTEEQTVLLKYTSTLLHACKKTCDAATAIIRKRPANDDDPLLEAVHRCHVGTLLPSLVLSLPLFPVDVQCTISPLVQSCSESLSALSATSNEPTRVAHLPQGRLLIFAGGGGLLAAPGGHEQRRVGGGGRPSAVSPHLARWLP